MVGILYDATAGNNDCNGKIAACAPNDPCPDLKDCLHMDDVKASIKFQETAMKCQSKGAGDPVGETIDTTCELARAYATIKAYESKYGPLPVTPPIDNAHVAEGCEKFSKT